MPKYKSTKTYGHDIGLSACFRQWRAETHCRFLHGYALSIHLEFEADELDRNNWVMDFGGLKPLKAMLERTFDHKLLVAHDDPSLALLKELESARLADLVIVDNTGCEAFANMVFGMTESWLRDAGHSPRVRLNRVDVREHGANSAIYEG